MQWPIVGNERAVQALAAAVKWGAVQHAYLFSGPDAVGRAATARVLAQALNCLADEGERPCGDCVQCRRIAAGIHSDVQTLSLNLEEGSPVKVISIEQLRDMEKAIAHNPYEGRTRVVIIDLAELLSEQAQHAFLKTLEEPPQHVVFMLIAADPDRLLETIRSRCARVDFHLVPSADIEAALAARGTPPEEARLLARLAGGRPGWALAAAADPAVLERRRETLGTARRLPTMSLADRFDLAERMSDAFKRDRDPVMRTIEQWQAWWRDVLVAQLGAPESVANADLADDVRADAEEYNRDDVTRFVDVLLDTRSHLATNVQSRIALDRLMIEVPRAGRGAVQRR